MAESSETLALAAEEKAKQGVHELEISFGGELDLHKHYNNCTKNPGHHKFIPIKRLEESPIPTCLVPWVLHMSDFTVKLSVNYVSPNRPSGYPLSGRAGQNVLSVGSGYVSDVSSTESDKFPCPFKNCDALPVEHEVRGYITVVTAAHVVFDDEEAIHTSVEFFYDDPDDKSGVVTARGIKVRASSVEGDFCELLCVTHDTRLCQRLRYLQKQGTQLTVELSVNYVSPNRARRHPLTGFPYPLSGRAGKRVVSTGQGYVTDIARIGGIGTLDRLRAKFSLSSKKISNYFTVVTTPQVVFDDEEARHTTVALGDMTARGVKVIASSVGEDFCELLCRTTGASLLQLCRPLGTLRIKGKRICHIFKHLLPGIENIVTLPGKDLKLLANVRLGDHSEVVEVVVVLGLFTEDIIESELENWDLTEYSLKQVIDRSWIDTKKLLIVIECLLCMGQLRNDNHRTKALSLLQKSLTEMRNTLTRENSVSRHRCCKCRLHRCKCRLQRCQDTLLSLISELRKYFSTLRSLEEMLSVFSTFHDIRSNNRLILIRTRNGIATVEVTFRRNVLNESRRVPIRIPPKIPLDADVQYKDGDMLIVHIAHPHGQSKQVTVGRQTDCFTGDGFYHQLYTAPTCPGCSGGPVWMIPRSEDLSRVYGVPHCRHHGNELNEGSSWTVYPHTCNL